ncbi:MAG TPA: LysR substrate-binding domain-containing protein [Sphingomicrobium sp.]|nr:LysR substrate-binding domain-containing protein [Sphingomicrobium sp.]
MPLPSSLLPELPALLMIAEECHFGRAAERLNVSQPRVSQIVRRIEDLVGYQIFFRRPRIRLTPAGALLVRAASQAMHELNAGHAHAGDAAAGRRGRVRLGYAPVAMMTNLPRILKSFHERNPFVELQLGTTYSASLWTDFGARKYDLIVSREAHDRFGITNRLFARDRLVVALPEGDPAAREGELPLARLAGRDFITSDEALAPQWHRTITLMCQAAGFEPHIKQRTNDWGATLALVASGLGVSIMSSTLAHVHFPGVEFVPLGEVRHTGCFWISYRENGIDTAVELLLLELIENAVRD